MDAVLFAVGGLVLGIALTIVLSSQASKARDAEFERRVEEKAEQIAESKLKSSASTLKGQIGERFAPFVPGFGYEAAGARFLGSPIDYVVFDGISDGEIKEIAFVEVKTGRLPLTEFQKQVKRVIDEKRVTWRVVELPSGD